MNTFFVTVKFTPSRTYSEGEVKNLCEKNHGEVLYLSGGKGGPVASSLDCTFNSAGSAGKFVAAVLKLGLPCNADCR